MRGMALCGEAWDSGNRVASEERHDVVCGEVGLQGREASGERHGTLEGGEGGAVRQKQCLGEAQSPLLPPLVPTPLADSLAHEMLSQ